MITKPFLLLSRLQVNRLSLFVSPSLFLMAKLANVYSDKKERHSKLFSRFIRPDTSHKIYYKTFQVKCFGAKILGEKLVHRFLTSNFSRLLLAAAADFAPAATTAATAIL